MAKVKTKIEEELDMDDIEDEEQQGKTRIWINKKYYFTLSKRQFTLMQDTGYTKNESGEMIKNADKPIGYYLSIESMINRLYREEMLNRVNGEMTMTEFKQIMKDCTVAIKEMAIEVEKLVKTK
ncbi:MAG: hypothetical protein ACRC1P_10005 [Cellulosilyticaceae bacterium]